MEVIIVPNSYGMARGLINSYIVLIIVPDTNKGYINVSYCY